MPDPILKNWFLAALLCLSLSSQISSRAADPAETTPLPIQQKVTDLLAGFSKGVAYSGFRHGQHPDRGTGAVNPTENEIQEDLRLLSRNSNFGLIRLYDSRNNSEDVLRIIRSGKFKMKVLLGAWLDAELSNKDCPWLKEPIPQATLETNQAKNRGEIENAIRLANGYPDVVIAVNVGNEALVKWSDHLVPVNSVVSYVRSVKKSIHQPVTVADNYDWWAHDGASLAPELDFVSVHTYPAWEGKTVAEALAFTKANLQAVRRALPKARIVITEAGWATAAREFGDRAGEPQQKRYYQDLYAWTSAMNITTLFFEAFDEDWKGETNDPFGAEKHWGLFTVDRKPKMAIRALYPDLAGKQP